MLSTRYSCHILNKIEFFCGRLSKNTQVSNFMKIHRMGAELFRVDGRTGITKLTVAFRNFVTAHKNKCSEEKGWKRGVMGRIYMGGKVVKIEGLG